MSGYSNSSSKYQAFNINYDSVISINVCTTTLLND